MPDPGQFCCKIFKIFLTRNNEDLSPSRSNIVHSSALCVGVTFRVFMYISEVGDYTWCHLYS